MKKENITIFAVIAVTIISIVALLTAHKPEPVLFTFRVDDGESIITYTTTENLDTIKEYMDKFTSDGDITCQYRKMTTTTKIDEINGKKVDYQGDGTAWVYYINGKRTGNDISTEKVQPGDTVLMKYSYVRKRINTPVSSAPQY